MSAVAARLLLVSFAFVASLANAADIHPLVSSKYWVSAGAFFASADFKANAKGGVGGEDQRVAFETSMGSITAPIFLTWNLAGGLVRNEISGEATLDDESREFRVSDASASFPVPDIGAWYRFSPSDRWLLDARTRFAGPEINLTGFW